MDNTDINDEMMNSTREYIVTNVEAITVDKYFNIVRLQVIIGDQVAPLNCGDKVRISIWREVDNG